MPIQSYLIHQIIPWTRAILGADWHHFKCNLWSSWSWCEVISYVHSKFADCMCEDILCRATGLQSNIHNLEMCWHKISKFWSSTSRNLRLVVWAGWFQATLGLVQNGTFDPCSKISKKCPSTFALTLLLASSESFVSITLNLPPSDYSNHVQIL